MLLYLLYLVPLSTKNGAGTHYLLGSVNPGPLLSYFEFRITVEGEHNPPTRQVESTP